MQKRGLFIIGGAIFGVVAIFLLDGLVNDVELKERLLDRTHWKDLYGFTIQNIMWVVFFVGIGELFGIFSEVMQKSRGFEKHYLPEDDITILEIKDMPKIAKRVKEDDKTKDSLANFIKKLIIQFQTTKSTEQVANMLNYQIEIKSLEIENRFNTIRYISWFIPTMGFIGTVIGIADALHYAGVVNGTGDHFVAELTKRLAFAFDTTFLALVMSAVIVFLIHVIQGKYEENLVKIANYCLDNFVNRLYIQR